MTDSYQSLLENLKAYKRKYYKNILLRGSIFTVSVLITAFLVINGLEYFGNFNGAVRATLLFGFLGVASISAWLWILTPIFKLLNINKPITNEEASEQIGNFFPNIDDKLLNVIQLGSVSNAESDLLRASIQQKAKKLNLVHFPDAVQYSRNRKYLRYVLPPALLLFLILMVQPAFFTESTNRIINYDKTFEVSAPFRFEVVNKKLEVFKNEDFEIRVRPEGNAIPFEMFLINENGRKVRMTKKGEEFSYNFTKVQRNLNMRFEASGFSSSDYKVKVLERPNLSNFSAWLQYPSYVNRKNEIVDNTGNLIVPTGTRIRWQFKTRQTEALKIQFDSVNFEAKPSNNGIFQFEKTIRKPERYEVLLKNKFSQNKEKIEYYLNVIPDEYPTINLKQFEDTTLYNYLVIGGNISDDYGIRNLQFKYRVNRSGQNSEYQTIKLKFNPSLINQSYFHQLDLSELGIKKGDKLDYFVEVWDNDGVNGSKSTKTSNYQFALPDDSEYQKELEAVSAKTEKNIEKSLQKAKELKQELKDLQNRLRSKKKLNWQDKKMVENLMKKKSDLEKEIQQLQQQNQILNQKQDRFGAQNSQVAEKAKQLQKLMDELLNDETKQMYDRLNQMIDQNRNNQQIQQLLEQIDQKELNTEKELDRALEMFKRLKFEQKLDKTTKALEELGEKQEDLADKTEKAKTSELKKDPAKSDKNQDKNKGENSENKSEENSKENPKNQDKLDKNTEKNSDKNSEKKDGNKPDKNQKSDKSDQNPKDKNAEKNAEKNQQNKKSEDSKSDKSDDQKSIQEKQEDLQKQFEEIQKQSEDLEKMNEDLEKKKSLPEDLKKQQEEIQKQLEQANEKLKNREKQAAAKEQRDAAKKMKQLAKKMKKAGESAMMQQQIEDYNDLRQILENLVTLSFDQEDLMKNFKGLRPEDPRLVPLGQKQLKLRDDAKIIEDSLMALSKRVFQIESFVTRELTAMNKYMDESTENIRQRKLSVSAGKQQFAMTSMNNLALMLDQVLHDMQQSMGEQMGGMQMINKKRPQKGEQSLGGLQKKLNEQIQKLQKSGKSGSELSKELAKLAAQQEMIRQAVQQRMKELQQGGNPKGKQMGNELGKMLDEMEKTEEDLVNKRITQETINRQKKIETRLLESDKAMRERKTDQERESQSGKQKKRQNPSEFSDYLKLKEKQIELLKTIPPSLNPYYKQEVNEYFKKMAE